MAPVVFEELRTLPSIRGLWFSKPVCLIYEHLFKFSFTPSGPQLKAERGKIMRELGKRLQADIDSESRALDRVARLSERLCKAKLALDCALYLGAEVDFPGVNPESEIHPMMAIMELIDALEAMNPGEPEEPEQ